MLAFVLPATASIAWADPLVAPGKRATVTVEYEYIAQGQRADKYDRHEWQARRFAAVKATLEATRPFARPPTGASAAAQQKAAEQAMQAMQPAMADMLAIVEKCKGDEACISRAVMQNGNSNRAALNDARSRAAPDIARVNEANQTAPTVQIWQPVGRQSGRYEVQESQRLVDADPICRSLPGQRCRTSITRSGQGDLVTPPGARVSSGMIEVDAQSGQMVLRLPQPLSVLEVSEEVKTDHPSPALFKPGSRTRASPFPPAAAQAPLTVPLKGDSIAQTGERRIPIQGAQKNPRTLEGSAIEDGTLTIRWSIATP